MDQEFVIPASDYPIQGLATAGTQLIENARTAGQCQGLYEPIFATDSFICNHADIGLYDEAYFSPGVFHGL